MNYDQWIQAQKEAHVRMLRHNTEEDILNFGKIDARRIANCNGTDCQLVATTGNGRLATYCDKNNCAGPRMKEQLLGQESG